MAAFLHVDSAARPTYRGLPSIFEFTNGDGELCRTNCGQAAAATFLTHHGHLQAAADSAIAVMRRLENQFPPDNLGGALGTSRRRVEQILRAHGVRTEPVDGEDELRCCLDEGRPVIVMLGVSAGRLWNRIDLPGGHWMVAYGYDEEGVLLTNYGTMPWDDFRKGWGGIVPWLIRMRRRGLVALEVPDAVTV